ncbi:MAG: SIR2 family NAD-dependent protein deacylase [Acidimicrobiales bacterium]
MAQRIQVGDAESIPGGPMSVARSLLGHARRVTVLTGAGISTDSGIPDFRGPDGVWTRNPSAERTSNISQYLADPEIRRLSWRQRLDSPAWAALPNPGHRSLVDLERQGRLVAVLTQNVDGLHHLAGHDPSMVVELHGTIKRFRCWDCGDEGPMQAALARVRSGDPDPACEACGGILKSATISFGQSLDPAVVAAAERAATSCDVMLAVGTTLGVYPAAGLVPLARRCGAKAVIINAQETPFDSIASAVIRVPISQALVELVGSPVS